jgi:hypothetical protein
MLKKQSSTYQQDSVLDHTMQSIVFNEDSFNDFPSKQKSKEIVNNDAIIVSKKTTFEQMLGA